MVQSRCKWVLCRTGRDLPGRTGGVPWQVRLDSNLPAELSRTSNIVLHNKKQQGKNILYFVQILTLTAHKTKIWRHQGRGGRVLNCEQLPSHSRTQMALSGPGSDRDNTRALPRMHVRVVQGGVCGSDKQPAVLRLLQQLM